MNVESPTERPRPFTATQDPVAKINDIDGLVGALSQGVSATKPWARQLASQLRRADICIEILRLTLLLERDAGEVAEAASELRIAAAAAQSTVVGGRADATTQAALMFILRLAQDVDRHYRLEAERQAETT